MNRSRIAAGRTRIFPVLVPGIFAGCLIPAVLLLADPIAGATGRMRAELFPALLFTLVPLILFLAGGISARLAGPSCPERGRLEGAYLSGVLAGIIGVALFAFEAGMTQHHPFLAEGLIPRLGFAFGMLILYLTQPVFLALICLLSLFSLAGGFLAVYMGKRKNRE